MRTGDTLQWTCAVKLDSAEGMRSQRDFNSGEFELAVGSSGHNPLVWQEACVFLFAHHHLSCVGCSHLLAMGKQYCYIQGRASSLSVEERDATDPGLCLELLR